MIPIIRHQPDTGNKTMPTVIGIGQSSAASRRAADGIEPLLVGRGIRLGLFRGIQCSSAFRFVHIRHAFFCGRGK